MPNRTVKTILILSLISIYTLSCKRTKVIEPTLSKELKAVHLKCEYKINPIGIDETIPRLYWQVKADTFDKNILQTAYQIQAATDKDFKKLIWDTEKTDSDQSIHIDYEGDTLQSRQRIFWRVKVWDNQNRVSEWSAIAFWEMAILEVSEWQAQWITPDLEEIREENPCPLLRKDFFLKQNIKKARLYITSKGLYEAYLNGQKVTEDVFNPGWTSYKKRIQYQTYDVTKLLQNGQNAFAVRLGDGWFRSRVGWVKGYNRYGRKLALFSQLEVEYENGEKAVITSDNNWKASTGAVLFSTIYDGEIYDARLEKTGWTTTNYDDKDWSTVSIMEEDNHILLAQQGEMIRKTEIIHPKRIIKTPKGETVLDFGQNLVGWLQIDVQGNRGDSVKIYHAEVLDKAGNFYTKNLRTAKQQLIYVCKGGQEFIEPHFTFYGFRYVKIASFPEKVRLDQFKAVVIHSDMERTGSFVTSDSLLNQLQSNIVWSQRGNFLDIPTDCPQRDERMGWTGDAQVFAATACFNYNTTSFFTKWLSDLEADQLETGSVPWVIPNVLKEKAGSTGWGDAAVIIPYTMYLKYGDKRILERQYNSMKQWLHFLESLAEDDFLIKKGRHFGDWLAYVNHKDPQTKSGYTDKDLISTAFYAYSTRLMSKIATVLEKKNDAKFYQKRFDHIKNAFQNEYITPNGRMSSHTQTAYILALHFGLLNDEQQQQATDYLVDLIKYRKGHLSTGFLGTPYICDVLTDNGQLKTAQNLIMQKTHPSWLYAVTKGATTIWERWDGIKNNNTFHKTKINSFNHYAYGGIGNWMYKTIGGIQEDEEQPGYKHIILKPIPQPQLNFAEATYYSIYGKIHASWKREHGKVAYQFEIPPNTTATLYLQQSNGSFKKMELGSGDYKF